MNKNNIIENIIKRDNNCKTVTTDTDLQRDVGITDTSNSIMKCSSLQILKYKIDEHDKKLEKIEKNIETILEETKMSFIDKLNKYKELLGILIGVFGAIITILFNLYNNSIQTNLNNQNDKINEINDSIKLINAENKELNSKIQTLEIKIIDNNQRGKLQKF